MIVRGAAVLIGLFNLANAFRMIAAPEDWFASVSRREAIGAYNPHLVTDVGLAFLAAGLAFLAYAWRPKWKLIAFGASGFIVFHAVLHLIDFVRGEGSDVETLAVIVLSAILAVTFSVPRAEEA